MASSRSCTSTIWCGARSSCEYCLAAPTRPEIRVTASSISSISSSVSTRVGEPAHRRLEVVRADRAGDLRPATSASSPPATSVGAMSQRAGDVVVLQPVAELVLGVAGLPSGSACGALATRSTASSCSSTSVVQPRCRRAARRRASPACAASRRPARAAPRWPAPPPRPGCSARGSARPTASRAPAAARARRRCVWRVPHAEEQALEQVHRHREPVAHDACRTRRRAARRTRRR